MTCPICFFRDSYQRSLKTKTFGIDKFELKLSKYKKLYLDELKTLTSLRDCNCYFSYNNNDLCLWTDEFLLDIKSNIQLIEDIFDQINSCYNLFISENQRAAINHLCHFLESSSLINRLVDSFELVTPLFRARWKGSFNKNDINEFYHVPFSKRQLVGSQRFSIPGLPLLYLGSSILTIEKELEANENNNLEYAMFLPSYSHFYNLKIFNLKNNINNLLEKNLPGIIGAGVNYPYSSFISYKSKFKEEIIAYILLQICSFPTESKCAFVPEYVIPQMLTTALQEKGFSGLTFPSTKCFESLKNNHRFSSHHLNFVIFTKYQNNKERDEDLLSKFFTFTLKKQSDISIRKVLDAFEEIIEINKKGDVNNTDYVTPLIRAQLQIEYLEKSSINGVSYFDTDTGKTELSLYMDMAKEMLNIVEKRMA